MDVGLFLPMEPHTRSASEQFGAVIEMARAAESLGYTSMWLVSRHLSPDYASVASPLVLLAAVAQSTERLVLGPSVVTLPLEHPVKLAEDFATLDAICDGRARLGVGAGDDAPAFEAFHVDFEERRELMSDRLPKLISILEGSPVSGLPLHPAVSGARDKVGMAAQSPGAASWAGSLGIGLLQGRSEPDYSNVDRLQAEAASAYRKIHPTGRVVTARNAWIGTVRDELFLQGMRRHDEGLRARGRPPLPEDHDEAVARLNIISGTAPEVSETLMRSMSIVGADELLITVDPGGLPLGEIVTRLEQMSEALGLNAIS